MPSVAYDQSLYRTGFRPSNTNPFAATQLSGIFSPQHLHGFFTPTGGSALHGLGAMVPNQAVVNYQGTWPLGGKAASALLAQVSGALAQDGLVVRGMSSDAGFLANSPNVPFVQQLTFNVRLQIQVTNGMGYGDPNDIISIIRHEVYVATGQFPITDSIPTVQVPAGDGGVPSAPTATGQPDSSAAPVDLGQWLSSNALLIGAGIVAAMVLPKVLGR